MIEDIRKSFNASFSEEKYALFLNHIQELYPNQLDFRVAETPIFVPKLLKEKIVDCCDSIIDVICQPNFGQLMEHAIPKNNIVPNENEHTSFLAIDFAICKDKNGELEPQLIELQGFPSVFGFQSLVSDTFKKYYDIPLNFSHFFNHDSTEEYFESLKKLIVGQENPANVILLEIFPKKQKTRIDFAVTESKLGIKVLCLTKIIKEGKQLFYLSGDQKIQIKRIYNRLIFDELDQYKDLQLSWHPSQEANVEWIGHPNWFFKISKYLMPHLKHQYIPETNYLSTYKNNFPTDLENYVLKPLFSFAGSGVILDVNTKILNDITDPENFIIQRKVKYEPVIQALEGEVKCEIRMLFVWPKDDLRPTLLTNLGRLSRGKMIGVSFNKDFDWVGGSTCFFEK